MSLVGLRTARAASASTSLLSAQPLLSAPAPRALPRALPRGPAAARARAASSRAAPGSIQAVDEQLERQARDRTRQAGMVDYAAVEVPVMERVVDPGPARTLALACRKGFVRYIQERLGRWKHTTDGLRALGTGRFMADQHASTIRERLAAIFRPQAYAAKQLQEFSRMYDAYHRAQAAGDLAHIRSVSTGAALAAATKVAAAAAARGSMSWAREGPLAARLVSARVHGVDPAGRLVVAQCVVRFESDQTLTLARKSAPARRQHVVELVVFERYLSASGAWKLKDKIEAQLPEYVKVHGA